MLAAVLFTRVSVSGLEYVGCYVDSWDRIFPFMVGSYGDNTPANCAQRCIDDDGGKRKKSLEIKLHTFANWGGRLIRFIPCKK